MKTNFELKQVYFFLSLIFLMSSIVTWICMFFMPLSIAIMAPIGFTLMFIFTTYNYLKNLKKYKE